MKTKISCYLVESIVSMTNIIDEKSSHYQNIICIDLNRSKIVATNGVTLCQHVLLESDKESLEGIVDKNYLEKTDNKILLHGVNCLKLRDITKDKRNKDIFVSYDFINDCDALQFSDNGLNIVNIYLKSYFPNYTEVLPDEKRATMTIGLNVSLLNDLVKAMNGNKKKIVTLKISSDSSAIIVKDGIDETQKKEINLIMPMNVKKD